MNISARRKEESWAFWLQSETAGLGRASGIKAVRQERWTREMGEVSTAQNDQNSSENDSPPTCLHHVQLGVTVCLDSGGLLGRPGHGCLITGWHSGPS